MDMYFGAREAEATCLLRDLETAAFPLHDVVVADDTFVHEATDAVVSRAVQLGKSGQPGHSLRATLPMYCKSSIPILLV